jgi:hypothetical protein
LKQIATFKADEANAIGKGSGFDGELMMVMTSFNS